ncbi:MAG TPA: multifunctional oxoglutarate decarboxylase/oxoglutarate dehydrogenase thiamine pyrophosphate-binding subunit/dihydrolipoyllysine-residue succinyltransferase subunit [Candidatus Limnocylindria bacterium]|nr:multifunctional oxoglutarate decarboxylase/oxoglutarate dehydrogenase thiamine pyrophosphate-binding subunit/dihydrolipoyllysine-residue succinyltransferase subunit [Candidatus Limnocylindria bacterium]
MPTDPDQPAPSATSEPLDELNLVNAGYVADLYERYRLDPASVDPEWRTLFDSGATGLEPVAATPPTANGDQQQAAAAAAPPAPPASAEPPVPEGATAIKGPAAALARNMAASLDVPTATSVREIPVTTLEARRRELNAQIAPRKVSFTHLVGWAIVRAAAEQRSMSHFFTTVEGTPYRVDPGAINLGLAVDVERPGGRFLVVPVIRDADEVTFDAFHQRYEELVEKARTNKLAADDFVGATITLTNPGTLGTTMSVPRLMPNQGTIVATGAIRDVGGERRMTITSTYDHRIIQGAESGAFLRRVEALLSGEDAFYADVFAALGARAADVTTGEPMPAPAEAIAAPPPATAGDADEPLKAVAAGMALVKAYRHFGHLAAHLDPLGSEPPGDPALDPGPLGLTEANMAGIPAELMRIYVPGATLGEALPRLRDTYSGTIAYEVEHIGSHEERVWLRRVIESGEHRRPMEAEDQLALFERLVSVEALERFLHRAYLGQKRFSIEGLDTMVPMLDVILGDAADQGARRVMIGMAHRGRLNVLAHVVGVSYEAILAEFEAGRAGTDAPTAPKGGSDDVKYHLGAEGSFLASDDAEVRVILSPNPSHLEAVNPVIEGRTRAEQTDRSRPIVTVDHDTTLPILIHGDAAFAAQGVVAETLNLARLDGYATGGTVHLIANNQVGFTTGTREGRSTDYSSDLAKGFDAPIVHVNADDPEACLAAARLAMMYRERFGHDVVIDLVGYRRYGHNEGDEPAYSQPAMYAAIDDHPSVRELYQARLVEAGVISEAQADKLVKDAQRDLAKRQATVRKRAEEPEPELDRGPEALPPEDVGEPEIPVPLETLRDLNAGMANVPDGFAVHPKLVKQLEQRVHALDRDQPSVNWAHAELLAFASLLREGIPVRLTGQDTVRGTFSQRHAGLWDAGTGEPHVPLQHLPGAKASFELHNSPLSEYACLGFEYGYAVAAPDALVLWEAQYGDFVNGAEIIIDQFLVSGLAKWRQTSRLTLLLPHGYEGSGPEHSSARLERFLALGAEGNIRVVYPTTPAQYFHLLRRQARHPDARPLVVMTPKSLLRLPQAASRPGELADGAFRSVLDDPRFSSDRAAGRVRRLLLCSGKVYYDLLASPDFEAAKDVAVVRVERLYPFPAEDLQPILDRYPKIESFAWVQEEPRNMGARKFVLPRIRHLVPYKIPLGDISRPERSRPAEGYPATHHVEQARIVREALTER